MMDLTAVDDDAMAYAGDTFDVDYFVSLEDTDDEPSNDNAGYMPTWVHYWED